MLHGKGAAFVLFWTVRYFFGCANVTAGRFSVSFHVMLQARCCGICFHICVFVFVSWIRVAGRKQDWNHMASPARDEAPGGVECLFTSQRHCHVWIMPAPITTPQGQGCDNWGAQGICVSWRGSTQERLSSESTFAKVPYKAALEKRLQHSQTSLESSRQATRVSHQKKSAKAIFEWPLAEIRHKRSKNCTKAPRKQAKQECLPKVPPRSLPDSPLSVSCRMCPRECVSQGKSILFPSMFVSNQCTFSLWNVHRHVLLLSMHCELRFPCSTTLLFQRSLKFPWYRRYGPEVEFRLHRLIHAHSFIWQLPAWQSLTLLLLAEPGTASAFESFHSHAACESHQSSSQRWQEKGSLPNNITWWHCNQPTATALQLRMCMSGEIVTRDYDPALREELVECVKLCWCRLAGVLLHERTLLAAVEAKSLTPSVYERVGDAFRRRFGSSAAVADLLLVD